MLTDISKIAIEPPVVIYMGKDKFESEFAC